MMSSWMMARCMVFSDTWQIGDANRWWTRSRGGLLSIMVSGLVTGVAAG